MEKDEKKVEVELVNDEREKRDEEESRGQDQPGFNQQPPQQGGEQNPLNQFMQNPFGQEGDQQSPPFPPMPPMPMPFSGGGGSGGEFADDMVKSLAEYLLTGGDDSVQAAMKLNRLAMTAPGKIANLKTAIDVLVPVIYMIEDEERRKTVKEAGRELVNELKEELERSGNSDVAERLKDVYHELFRD